MKQSKIEIALEILATLDENETIAVLSKMIMTSEEVQERLDVSRTTLSRLLKDKEIVRVKTGVYLTSSIERRKQTADKNAKYKNSLKRKKSPAPQPDSTTTKPQRFDH